MENIFYNEPIDVLELLPIQQRLICSFAAVSINVAANKSEFDKIFGKTTDVLDYILDKIKARQGLPDYRPPYIIENLSCSACVSLAGIAFVLNNDLNCQEEYKIAATQKNAILINALAQITQLASDKKELPANNIKLFYQQQFSENTKQVIFDSIKNEWYNKFISIWWSVCQLITVQFENNTS